MALPSRSGIVGKSCELVSLPLGGRPNEGGRASVGGMPVAAVSALPLPPGARLPEAAGCAAAAACSLTLLAKAPPLQSPCSAASAAARASARGLVIIGKVFGRRFTWRG